MLNMPNITESELKIMNILWNEYPLTSNEIIDRLCGYNGWSITTIRTFISRLVSKNAIRTETDNKDYRYYPNISHRSFLKYQNKHFLEKVYDSSPILLLKNLVEDDSLSYEELNDLKTTIENRLEKMDA